jgi:hypothetical protein
VHRQAGVDHGVDEQEVAPRDLRVEILQEPDSLVALAVAGDLDEVEGMQRPRRAGEVADERNARLERADQQWLAAGVVLGDRDADLADAALNLTLFEKDLADPCIGVAPLARSQGAQDAFWRPYLAARRAKSRS